jgi:hypothetical protein
MKYWCRCFPVSIELWIEIIWSADYRGKCVWWQVHVVEAPCAHISLGLCILSGVRCYQFNILEPVTAGQYQIEMWRKELSKILPIMVHQQWSQVTIPVLWGNPWWAQPDGFCHSDVFQKQEADLVGRLIVPSKAHARHSVIIFLSWVLLNSLHTSALLTSWEIIAFHIPPTTDTLPL